MKITLCQLNSVVGDFEGNSKKILKAHKNANKDGADLIVFSEMAICGYPPEDLVLRQKFQTEAFLAIDKIAKATENGTAILVGGIYSDNDIGCLYNSAYLLDEGRITHITNKYDLPNYGVFDEKRLFTAAPLQSPVDFRGIRLGIMICEDMWGDHVANFLKEEKADIVAVLNASPFEIDKKYMRREVACKHSKNLNAPFIYVNQFGGQDELVFSGDSFVASAEGEIVADLRRWKEGSKTIEFEKDPNFGYYTCKGSLDKQIKGLEAVIYEALKVGIKDYVKKNKFPGVVIGMSGGIDSALTAALAVDALGKDKVHLLMMPSKYTSKESIKDAKDCAKLLGVKLESISIEDAVEVYGGMMKKMFKGKKADTTEENIQSRLRGIVLMAISNKFNYMVLTTGNKSEMAVGYATLYGDMCGGFNALKDIYKTDVFALANWRNSVKKVIPDNIISKPPSAELKPDQKDQDSLPEYEILDDILKKIIEERLSVGEIVAEGFDKKTVERVAHLVKIAEYKRRQAPPGIKISRVAFGRDRRYPITSCYEF